MADILTRIDQALTECPVCHEQVDTDPRILSLYGRCYDCKFKLAGETAKAQIADTRIPRCPAVNDDRRCERPVGHEDHHMTRFAMWPREQQVVAGMEIDVSELPVHAPDCAMVTTHHLTCTCGGPIRSMHIGDADVTPYVNRVELRGLPPVELAARLERGRTASEPAGPPEGSDRAEDVPSPQNRPYGVVRVPRGIVPWTVRHVRSR